MQQRELRIELGKQRLICLEAGRTVALYPVSSARAGAGESSESGCTPRGRHRIRLKIGRLPRKHRLRCPRPSGEIYTDALALAEPEQDWILTRILLFISIT